MRSPGRQVISIHCDNNELGLKHKQCKCFEWPPTHWELGHPNSIDKISFYFYDCFSVIILNITFQWTLKHWFFLKIWHYSLLNDISKTPRGGKKSKFTVFFLLTIQGCCHVVEFKCSLNVLQTAHTTRVLWSNESCRVSAGIFPYPEKREWCSASLLIRGTRTGINYIFYRQCLVDFLWVSKKTRTRWKRGRWCCGQNLIMPNYQKNQLQI